MNLSGKTVLVTGGSGFIGGRLIEVLTRQYGLRVRTLVRGTTSAGSGAFRAAAAGAEIHFGSLLDRATLDAALAGCDLVFHCAYGTHGSLAEQRRVTLGGTRALAEAAAAAGVKHFVHLSTVASFGGNTPAQTDETFVNPRLWNWAYARDKLDAEHALADTAGRGSMPYTVLRLGMVYGPYGSSYIELPLSMMRSGQLAMVDGGEGVSSATYVDDVVQAMLLAAQQTGEGELYMIRGAGRVTWREYYEHLNGWLGGGSLTAMTKPEMLAAARRVPRDALRALPRAALAALKADPGFRRAAGGLPLLRTLYRRAIKPLTGAPPPGLPAPAAPHRPVHLIPAPMIDYFANRTEFSIAKAQSKLGYEPRFDLARGMALTEQWARWANLIPSVR